MQQTLPATATVEAITAIHLPHLNRMRAQNSTNSLLSHPLPIRLRAYVDGGGVPPRVANVTWRNLSVVAPWAQDYANHNLLYHSHMQRLYRQSKLRCITIAKMQSSGTCRDPQTAYKIAALYDAVVERRTSAHLLWIDSDAYFQRPLDAAFWGWAAQFDVAAIFRRGTGSMLMPYSPNTPETGVVFFNAASTATQQLMRDARLALFNTSEYMKASSVNDVSIFNLLLRRANPREMRIGRFAVGCRRKLQRHSRGKFVRWIAAARGYLDDPGIVDCVEQGADSLPAAASIISPFNLLYYITHAKGSGPVNQDFSMQSKTVNQRSPATRERLTSNPRPSHGNILHGDGRIPLLNHTKG